MATRDELQMQLDRTEAAIDRALNAASMGTGSRNVSRQSLKDLEARARRLRRQIAAKDGTLTPTARIDFGNGVNP